MQNSFKVEAIIDNTIGREGLYSNDPTDRGGATKYGVIERTARRNGFTGDMRDLTRDQAKAIYRSEFWSGPGFDKVYEIYPRVAEELFDTGVNQGTARAAMYLQEWLNALNNGGKLYADIKEDADVGPATLKALTAFKAARGPEGEDRLLAALNASQGVRYKEIARANPSQEKYVYGWLARTL